MNPIDPSIAAMLNIVTNNMNQEPVVKYDKNGDVTEDEFCRFSDDGQGIIDQDHQFHSLDEFTELSGEFLNPLYHVMRLEAELKAPLALCTTVITGA